MVKKISVTGVLGKDIYELLEVKYGLNVTEATEAMGLPMGKYRDITRNNPDVDVAEKTLALLYKLYLHVPESLVINIETFYTYLGFENNAEDREKFASLIGKSSFVPYRILMQSKKASRPVITLCNAVYRLNYPPRKALRLLKELQADFV